MLRYSSELRTCENVFAHSQMRYSDFRCAQGPPPTLQRSGARRTPVSSATRDSAGASACGGTARRSCGASQPRPAPPPPPRPPPAQHAPARRGGLPHAPLPGGTCRPRSPAPPRPSRRSRPRQHRRQRRPLPGTTGAEGRRDMPSAQRHAARRAGCGLAVSRWQQHCCVPQGTLNSKQTGPALPRQLWYIQYRPGSRLAILPIRRCFLKCRTSCKECTRQWQ